MPFSVPFLVCMSEKSAGFSTGSQSPNQSKGQNSRLVLVEKYKEVGKNKYSMQVAQDTYVVLHVLQ